MSGAPRAGRPILTLVLIAASGLCLLEATKDPGAADRVPRPGTPAPLPLTAELTDPEWVTLALENPMTPGWVPRGERPATVVRHVASELPAFGFRFGAEFFPDPEVAITMVEFEGLFTPQPMGMIQYRPPVPSFSQLTFLFLPGYRQPFAWGGSPRPAPRG